MTIVEWQASKETHVLQARTNGFYSGATEVYTSHTQQPSEAYNPLTSIVSHKFFFVQIVVLEGI